MAAQHLPEIPLMIREHEMFADLSHDEFQELLKIVSTQNYQKNEQIFSIDDCGNSFFLVQSGTCILSLRNEDHKVFQKGQIFGEVGVINRHIRTGSIRAMEDCTLFAFDMDKLYDPDIVHASTALKVLRALAHRVAFYLRSKEQVSTEELIEAGESDFIEFKSTLRYNIHAKKNDKNIEHAVLKTLAAFLNSEGGTLLIGVNDDGEILGLQADRFPNFDKMLLHLTMIIKSNISTIHTDFMKFEIEKISGNHVLRIDCDPATLPAYVKHNGEEYFYMRTGPSTTKVRVSKIYDYIRMRFK